MAVAFSPCLAQGWGRVQLYVGCLPVGLPGIGAYILDSVCQKVQGMHGTQAFDLEIVSGIS